MEIKEQLNEEKQRLLVETMLRKGYNLVKEELGKKAFFKNDDSYSLERLIENLRNNSIPKLYTALAHLLEDPFVNKTCLYTNLLKYRFEISKDSSEKVKNLNRFHLEEDDYEIKLSVEDNNIHAALHEMNHFSSYFHRGNCADAGLSHYDIEEDEKGFYATNAIGEGLNEGMTDFLTSLEIFDNEPYKNIDDKIIGIAYPVSYQFAKCLTKVIGIDKMKEFYYNGNLEGLIDEMAKYSDKGQTMAFIRKVDGLFEHLDRTGYIDWTDEFHNDDERIKDCGRYLYKLSMNKYGEDVIGEDLFYEVVGTQLKKEINKPQFYPQQLIEAYQKVEENMTK